MASRPDGEVFKVTDETNRTWYKLNDDSRLRMADDLDIAPDGKIYFSDCTTRYEMTTNTLDILEARPNGRMVCYDPATEDHADRHQSFLFPERRLRLARRQVAADRLYLAVQDLPLLARGTEKQGTTEVLIDQLPGNPDNINRASDGNYWLALVGIRTPTFDLAARKPGFRLRMVKQVPTDEWLAPALNHGCVLKFNESGEALESWWDPTGISHSTLTSMREHKGYLYLGGLENNRIGRIKLDAVDESWTGYDAYWGAKSDWASRPWECSTISCATSATSSIATASRTRFRRWMARSAPTTASMTARRSAIPARPRRRCCRTRRRAVMCPPAKRVLKLSGTGFATRTLVAEFDGDAGGLALHPDGRLLVCVCRARACRDRSGKASDHTGSRRPTASALAGLLSVAAGPDGRDLRRAKAARRCHLTRGAVI